MMREPQGIQLGNFMTADTIGVDKSGYTSLLVVGKFRVWQLSMIESRQLPEMLCDLQMSFFRLISSNGER